MKLLLATLASLHLSCAALDKTLIYQIEESQSKKFCFFQITDITSKFLSSNDCSNRMPGLSGHFCPGPAYFPGVHQDRGAAGSLREHPEYRRVFSARVAYQENAQCGAPDFFYVRLTGNLPGFSCRQWANLEIFSGPNFIFRHSEEPFLARPVRDSLHPGAERRRGLRQLHLPLQVEVRWPVFGAL